MCILILDNPRRTVYIIDRSKQTTQPSLIRGGLQNREENIMFNFIKWNWDRLLGILAIIAAVIAANAHILDVTRGAYNLFTLIY